MAITTTSASKARQEWSTELTDSTTKTNVQIVTQADGNRVFSIGVYVIVGSDDNNIYTNAQKEAVHTAVVNAISAKIGAGI